jgi:uncharacterized protein (DUF488 family)
MPRDLEIVGVGYEGLGLPAFLDRLRRSGTATLVDVRLTPLSRKPGFSKTALAAALQDAGIGYRHLRALGNPRDNRPGFGGSPTELRSARATFAGRLDTAPGAAALDRILELATAGPISLLCFEADEQRCHRYVVLERLRDRRQLALTG